MHTADKVLCHFRIYTVNPLYSATLTELLEKYVNRNSLLYLTFIYCHLLNICTNCREQTVLIYRGLTVCVRRSSYVFT